MCTVKESTASEMDLAPGPGRGPVFPVSRPWKKKGESTFPDCSQIHLFMQPNLYIR